MIKVQKYNSSQKSNWNNFVKKSKNGTFLFERDFIEYHSNRFIDYSLMIYDKKELLAIFPANLNKKTEVVSHSGLTYGGLVISERMKLNTYLSVFKNILFFLNQNGISILNYKSIPIFYIRLPSQEEEYAFFLLKAELTRVDTTLAIKNDTKISYQKRRERSIKEADNFDFRIDKDGDFKVFWEKILTPNLETRFGKEPVHTLEEIELLKTKFPKNIHQINIFQADEIVAGCTIFETHLVAHAQYIAANDFGRKSGILDKLFDYLITELFVEKAFFNFGICNEDAGRYINQGLLDWKESFGGRTSTHKFYSINTAKYHLLDTVLI